jgi:hypothetical protein
MENNNTPNVVEATVYLKQKNEHSPDKAVALITFIDNGHLYTINNLGNKQIMLGKDKSAEFEKLVSILKIINNATSFETTRLDTSQYKEDETQESLRLKRVNTDETKRKNKNTP